MEVQTAIEILKEECESLGMNWGDLEHLLQERPIIFGWKVVNAYNTYRAHTKEES